MAGRVIEPWKIQGLKEFQAALKATETGLQTELRVVFNQAAERVAASARQKVPTTTGRAAASIKTQSGQREAKVIGGSAKVPYYGFLDFGGKVGPRGTTTRPYRRRGRYLYPALDAHREAVIRDVAHGLADLAGRAGLPVEVSGA